MTQASLIPESQAAHAIATLTLAFAGDPMARWTWADPQVFLSAWPRMIRGMAGAAFQHGSAWSVDALHGVALWLPPGVGSDDAALEALFRETVPKAQQAQGAEMFARMEEQHPKEPHWYLPLVGVDPVAQGRKLGAALMAPALALCDRDGLPAYLESSNPRNVHFYERLGFRVKTTLQVGNSPELIPMLRPPRG
ncbi:MAG: GNAT family N-acetyltransferase [Polyangiales bacterium]